MNYVPSVQSGVGGWEGVSTSAVLVSHSEITLKVNVYLGALRKGAGGAARPW